MESRHGEGQTDKQGLYQRKRGDRVRWNETQIINHSTSKHIASNLVGALSPVNHKGLPKGRTQPSLYLQVIHFTSHHTQVMFFQPVYIPRALNTGTYTRRGDLFDSAGLHRNHESVTANTGEIGSGLEIMQVNGPEG